MTASVVLAAMLVGVGALGAEAASPNPPQCPAGKDAISSFSYSVNGSPVTDLNQNNVHAGDQVLATFTIAPNCTGVQVTFASYSVPPGGFTDLSKQVAFAHDTNAFNSGQHTLGPIGIPCSWQADLAVGPWIEHLGKPDFYGPRLKNSGTGTDICVSPSPTGGISPAATTSPSSSPVAGVLGAATEPPVGAVAGAAVTQPAAGESAEVASGFAAGLMVLAGIAILAESRRRRKVRI